MKHLFCFSLVLLLIAGLLSSCTYTVTIDGLDNFSREDSEKGLTRFLIPNGFLDMFSYIDGDYAYYDDLSDAGTYETALLYIRYDESTYEEAKRYALENIAFIENSEEIYNGYVFCQRLLDSTAHKDKRCFFAYSDEHRILLAVGTHITLSEGYNYTSIESFFNKYFNFYNFEAGKIEREQDESSTESSTVLT